MVAVTDRERDLTVADQTTATTFRHADHLLGEVNSRDETRSMRGRGALDGPSVPEAHLQHAVAGLKIEERERLLVRRRRFGTAAAGRYMAEVKQVVVSPA
jgi:hypothetical protein